MNKTVIKNFAIWARNKLIADIQYRAGLMGITAEEIKEYARQNLGMLTLKESCMELIEQGLTTVEELVKVAYYD
mgnify:CR=1 FL=1